MAPHAHAVVHSCAKDHMLRYISRKQKHCHCYNSAPSCFREKQQAGCLCYLGAAAHAGKCSQKWWSEKERGGTLCHAKTGTQNDKGRTHRPAEERSTETMAVVQKQAPGSGFTQLLQVCCRVSMPACLHACPLQAKQACMGRSNAEPRRNSIPKRE